MKQATRSLRIPAARGPITRCMAGTCSPCRRIYGVNADWKLRHSIYHLPKVPGRFTDNASRIFNILDFKAIPVSYEQIVIDIALYLYSWPRKIRILVFTLICQLIG